MEFWSRFYSCCLQYQEVQASPLGLTVSQHTGMVCLLRKVSGPPAGVAACLWVLAMKR